MALRTETLAFDVREGSVVWSGGEVQLVEILGIHEGIDPWTGQPQAWAEGTAAVWPLDDHWTVRRTVLRQHLADRPWTSDWSKTGRFEGTVGVWGGRWAQVVLSLLTIGGLLGLAHVVSPAWLYTAASVCAVGVLSLSRRLVVDELGIRCGRYGSPLWGWHEIEDVRVQTSGDRSQITVIGPMVGTIELPTGVLPAVRARIARLGRMDLSNGAPTLDHWYRQRETGLHWAPWVFMMLMSGLVVLDMARPAQVVLGGMGLGALGRAVALRQRGSRTRVILLTVVAVALWVCCALWWPLG